MQQENRRPVDDGMAAPRRRLRVALVCIFSLLSVIAAYGWCFPKFCAVEIDYSLTNANCLYSVATKQGDEIEKISPVLLRRGSGTREVYLKADELSSLTLQFGKFTGEITLHGIELRGRTDACVTLPGAVSVKNAKIVPGPANCISFRAVKTAPLLEIYCSKAIKGERCIEWSNLLTVGGCSFFLFWVLVDMWSDRKKKREAFQTPKLANIEFLRVFFTLMVVLRHIALICPAAANTGEWAVQFFFLLSGYLLFYTYRPERLVLSYAKDKVIRFVPLVVLGSVLCGAGAESLKGIFCLQGTGLLTRDVALNQPSWYIAVLFWCSLFYFALRRYVQIFQGNIIIGCVCFFLLIITVQSDGDRYKMVLEFFPLGLLDGIISMGLGYLMAQCCTRPQHPDIEKTDAGWTLVELGVIAYVVLSMFCMEYRLEGIIWVRISHITLLYLFIMKRGAITNMLEHRVFACMAQYCLSIYLTHWCIIELTRSYLIKKYPGLISQHEWACIAVGMVIAIVIGVLAHHLVEKPATQYLFSWTKGGRRAQG